MRREDGLEVDPDLCLRNSAYLHSDVTPLAHTGMVMRACNPCMSEAKAGGLRVPG